MVKTFDLTYWESLLIALALMVGGWAVFSLIKWGVQTLLIKWGVQNEWSQYVIIILFVIVVLVLAGFGVKTAIKKLVK